jgi:GTP-binding protein HflX
VKYILPLILPFSLKGRRNIYKNMEKVILVGIKLPKTDLREFRSSLSELESLVQTADAVPEITIIQNREKIDSAFFIGKGKADEIRDVALKNKIKTVIFDEDLKPVQQRNLEEVIGAKIIGRTRLILDIFAKRARSTEGMLQVELAQLDYMLPRMTEKFGTFEQQTGGIGTRGPGEKKLEVDQRRVRERISFLKKQIETLRQHRQVIRQKRVESGTASVAIVGYTNAGKSSLLNALSDIHKVYADNKLFATLDPTTRHVLMPGGRSVLFTDTVGFIRKLPHALVAAFRSTLEEINFATCIIHLIDMSQPDYKSQAETTLKVLKEIGAKDIPIVSVYNKADIAPKEVRNKLKRQKAIMISAKTKEGIDALLKHIEKIIMPGLKLHKIVLPFDKTKDIPKLYNLAVIKKQEYLNKGIRLYLECTKEHWEIIKNIIA